MGRGASIEAATRWRTGRSGRPLSVVRRLGVAALAGLTSCSVVALVAPAAHADIRFGLEQVDIRNVEVGSPVMSTTSNCEGFVRHDSPVIPVTIEASFIPPPGGQPIGPYVVANWSGGFGGVDDHFGRGQADEFVQFFHILLTVDSLQYHGPGVYSLDVIVQDVGLASGYDEHDEIPVHIGGLPPSTAHANVKCATVGDGLAGLKDAAGSEVVSLGKEIFQTLGCLDVQLVPEGPQPGDVLRQGAPRLGARPGRGRSTRQRLSADRVTRPPATPVAAIRSELRSADRVERLRGRHYPGDRPDSGVVHHRGPHLGGRQRR